jgi:stress-induced morphogen
MGNLMSSVMPRLSSKLSKSYSSDALAAPDASPPKASNSEPPSPTTIQKSNFLNEAESVIWDRLVAEFDPKELVVQDISGGCGSMYGIEISSQKFHGASVLKQQRMVNAVLGDLMKNWHGLQLKTRVP